jgi:hypothetical protein
LVLIAIPLLAGLTLARDRPDARTSSLPPPPERFENDADYTSFLFPSPRSIYWALSKITISAMLRRMGYADRAAPHPFEPSDPNLKFA